MKKLLFLLFTLAMTWSYGQTFDHVTEIKIDGNYLVLRDTTDNDSTQYAAWKIDYLIYDNHLELKNNDRTVLFTPIDSLVEVDKSPFTIYQHPLTVTLKTGRQDFSFFQSHTC